MKISKRCSDITASVTLQIDAAAKELRAQGKDVVGLGAGEPDCNTPENIICAAKAALDSGKTRYTPASGTLALRQAICDKLLRDNGLDYTPAQIVVSNGAKHSLYNTFFAILDPGDEVLIPAPCWVSYPEQVRMCGGKPVFVMASPQADFKPTIDEWKAALTPKTKAIILNSPNNPNGCVYNRQELTDLAQFAVENDLYVVSDEIYEYLIYDGEKHISIASLGEEIKKRTIVINGVSKAYAMTGWRIGYTACEPALAKAMGNFQSHATSNPNSVAQEASVAALNGGMDTIRQMNSVFDQRRTHLCGLINRIDGLSCRTPKGAFYVMMDISGILGKSYHGEKITCPMDFARLLLEKSLVALVPGEAFMADTYCRISYATSTEQLEKAMGRIADFVAELTD